MSVKILLNSIENVKKFISIISLFDTDMDMVFNGYVVDAKSLVGILSTCLSKPAEFRIHGSREDAEIILGRLKDLIDT